MALLDYTGIGIASSAGLLWLLTHFALHSLSAFVQMDFTHTLYECQPLVADYNTTKSSHELQDDDILLSLLHCSPQIAPVFASNCPSNCPKGIWGKMQVKWHFFVLHWYITSLLDQTFLNQHFGSMKPNYYCSNPRNNIIPSANHFNNRATWHRHWHTYRDPMLWLSFRSQSMADSAGRECHCKLWMQWWSHQRLQNRPVRLSKRNKVNAAIIS